MSDIETLKRERRNLKARIQRRRNSVLHAEHEIRLYSEDLRRVERALDALRSGKKPKGKTDATD